MSVEEAVEAVIKLNPHPGCYAKGRWVPARSTWEFPMIKEPLTREVAEQHVRGKIMIGGVASDEQGYTTSVGLDLDAHLAEQHPARAARRFVQVAEALDVPVVVHTSKSGKGAHIRTLFADRVPTHLARAMYVAMVVTAGLSADKAVDKVWPPTHGLGVLALPYNGKIAMHCGGTLALDPWSLKPLPKADQLTGVLDSEELARDDLENTLVAMEIRTDEEARLLSGSGHTNTRAPDGLRQIKDQADGGIQHMLEICDAVKRLGDEAPHLSYEFWFSMMTNFRPFIGGYDIFAEYSRLDPVRFNERHLTRTWQAISGGPRRCDNLDTGWQCPKYGVCPAKSPAGLPFAVERSRKAHSNG